MADFAASIFAPIVNSGLKYVGAIIKRQFIYLFCFTSNIIGLESEAKRLDAEMQGVQAKVNDITNNAQDIHPKVTLWIEDYNTLLNEKNIIIDEVPKVKGGCLRLAARFSLSRRAKKTTEDMAQHRQNSANFKNISLPAAAVATKEIPLGITYAFDSRKKVEQEIMKTLRNKEENVIAIHGMGGLGKTTMAKRIMNALLTEKVFDEVVIAVVSQLVDVLKIQLNIGEPLGLKNLKDQTTQQARAQILHARLCATTTRTLLVLDDVWESLELEDIGIPCASEGCTILITSRNSDALSAMDVEKVFEIEHLSEDDAWFMFREKVGICVDDKKLKPTAKEVMRECRGLPIALESLGAALKDEKSNSVWKDILKRLRKPNPKNTPHYIAEVYSPMIVSYDKLDEEFKTPFLLCCLFPEDDNISVELLTYFCMGLRLFEDLGSLGEVRDRMCSLVKMLKSRSLLLDGDYEDHVRLHDVVRDVCIFIAKQERYIGGNHCTWISNSQRVEARSTNLHLLFSDDDEFRIDTLFEGTRELYVLYVKTYSWRSLPHTTQSLTNLRTLFLAWCSNLETICDVGSLVHLEILICRCCDRIKELPEEIRGLKHLKLLEFTWCHNLQSIGRGIISSLVELEEFKMVNSFDGWEAADLRELEALTKLTCLEIQIADQALVAEDINLSTNLERFDIRFAEDYVQFQEGFNKKLVLRLDEGARLGNWIIILLQDTECVCVQGNGANIQTYFSKIQWLGIERCGGIKNIATTLAVVEHLDLCDLPQLEEIWNGPANSLTFLQNLKRIRLSLLPALKHLWKSNTNIVSLPLLEILQIDECEIMEHLFIWNEEDENESNRGSPNPDVTKIQFPQLWKVSIRGCPKMRSIIPSTSLKGYESTSKVVIDDHSSHLFCQQQKVLFGGLKTLETEYWNPFCHHNHIYVSFFSELEKLSISSYGGSLCLFTVSVARNLVNLKELWIRYCDEMVAVMEDDKDEGITLSGGESNRPFPQLRELELRNLSKLVTFCDSKSDVELRSLKILRIFGCPNMTSNLSLAPLALEKVDTDFNCYLGVLFKEKGNHPSCSLHVTRLFSFVNGLQRLCINQYKGSTSIFSSSIAENLINLRELQIYKCYEMVKVIEGGERSSTLLFPKLQKLELLFLSKLEIFCEWESDVELPLLEKMEITYCPNMTKFTLGSVTTPCLNFVEVDYLKYRIDGSTELNGVLQQHFAKEKEINKEDGDEDGDSEGDAPNGEGDVEIENATKEAHEGEDEQFTPNEDE